MTRKNTALTPKNKINWAASAWDISISEYYGDPELRAAYDSIYRIMGKAKPTMEQRIASELRKRAAADCRTETGSLKMAALRDRLMMQRDFEAYKREANAR